MSEKFVTVATYNRTPEAHLAKNLLEEEGIASMLSGELTADMLPFGQAGGGDQIVLQVPESAAQRAASILAIVAAAKLEDNWEDEAESGSDVWICSICGEPISNRLSMCYSCQTPRESIRAAIPRDRTSIQSDPTPLTTGAEVQRHDEITDAPAPTPVLALPSAAPLPNEEVEITLPPTARGDDLARKAFLASLFGVVIPILVPVAWIYILRVVVFGGEMSAKGVRQFLGAVLINASVILVFLFLCAGGWRLF
ncbi:MAG TPA: hypothetical protein VH592_24955 [Gemmataceae bacterium]|jgi:hypothetical protein